MVFDLRYNNSRKTAFEILTLARNRLSFVMSKLVAKSLQGFNVVTVQGRHYRVAAASMDYQGDRPLAQKPGMRFCSYSLTWITLQQANSTWYCREATSRKPSGRRRH
jgi:hypothetical protein